MASTKARQAGTALTCVELCDVKLFDGSGKNLITERAPMIEFGDAPGRTADLPAEHVIAPGEWPEKPFIAWHRVEGATFEGKPLLILTFPQPVEVAKAEVYTTNDESFGGNAKLQLQFERDGEWSDLLTPTARGGLTIIYLAEGGLRWP